MRTGVPPVRGRREFGHRHRIRWQRCRTVHSDAGRAVISDEHETLRLGVRERTGTPSRQPQNACAARQGDRRVVLDQRHGVRARPCTGFQPLAGQRRDGLELCRRAALFQAHGNMARRRRRHLSRHFRPAARVARHPQKPLVHGLRRGWPSGWVSRHRGLQRRPAGRFRRHGADRVQGRTLVRRQGLSASGAETGKRLADPRLCPPDHYQGWQGHRRRDRP